ncbi:DUF1330 domain-containing protein [Microbulbifer bruguierae]|uniref:DUF1330 domain-containing protein n=1 Tax=Microbulbifer bruguierae TaxID=3029061 RepID=A0ABY8N9S5_9GAMM|nr:DUF1330 domain-containing protein [Microbulbifer bruguierae]WGL15357.1 DUF1330 domain-containing protein [Microbulbifer bruguierae]
MTHTQEDESYLHPKPEADEVLRASEADGPVVMLNLLRFREIADYRGNPDLAPDVPVSGAVAYKRYMAHSGPILARYGGEVIFMGEGGAMYIGPDNEHWHLMMLVRYPSRQDFLAFTSDAEYLAGLGHRVAALADSRLLPLNPKLGQ